MKSFIVEWESGLGAQRTYRIEAVDQSDALETAVMLLEKEGFGTMPGFEVDGPLCSILVKLDNN